MTLTNIHNLPDPLVRAVTFDNYDTVGDISVTGLLRPTQMAHLEAKHGTDVEEDVADRLWALLGSAAHEVLYRAGQGQMQERRLTMDVNGWTVSGKSDLYDPESGYIIDWKVTSVWSVIYEPAGRKEYHEQLNLYRLLLEANGYEVNGLQICAILRDWSERDRDRSKRPDYPAVPFKVIELPLWEKPFAMKFLENRVVAHQLAAEGDYVQCTDDERWLNNGTYTRCERYCKVAKFCSQHNG